MPKIRVGENELHYERAGSGEPLLMIQGMSGTHVAWGEPFLAPLREAFDVIAFDNRGIGLSAPIDGPFTIVDMAEDAAGLMDELGIESAHVVGISMGGMIAQDLALAHPDRLRSLTLGCTYSGGPGSQLMPQENVEILAAGMMSGDRDKADPGELRSQPLPRLSFRRESLRRLPRDGDLGARRETDDRTAGAGDLRPRHQRPPR
jgi:3-oxoadipate enol-lactonase